MDTIGNMITAMRNAGAIQVEKINVPYSKLSLAVANLLKEEGYVKAVHDKKEEYKIEIVLEYGQKGEHKIKELKRISKPGRRVYYKTTDIRKVKNGFGNAVLSTPQGIMTAKAARSKNTGGEVLFEIF
jgi:small subunit ribosomal protein S8